MKGNWMLVRGGRADSGPQKPVVPAGGLGHSGERPVQAVPQVLAHDVLARSLRLSDDALYFLDAQAGAGEAGAIRKVSPDGSDAALLFEGGPDFELLDLWVDETLYFLAAVPSARGRSAFLYRMDERGGTPTLVTPHGQGFDPTTACLFGSDAESLFVSHARHLHRIVRVRKADGAETVIAERDGLLSLEQVVHEDKVWFSAGQGLDGIWWVPKDADAPRAQRLGVRSSQGTLSVTPWGVFSGLKRLDEHGEVLEDLTRRFGDDLPPRMTRAYGDVVYLYSFSHTCPRIEELDLRTMRRATVASGLGSVYQVCASADEVFWVELQKLGERSVRSVMRAPRPASR